MASVAAQAPATDLPSLILWLHAQGITWEEQALQIRTAAPGCSSGLKLGVFAVKDISEGDVLCSIPKHAVLSVRNSSIHDLLEQEELGGGLGLILAVMHEMSQNDSRWAGYLNSLPRREYLPVFWTDDELALLQGTGVAEKALADRQLTKEDFQESILPVVKRHRCRLAARHMKLERFTAAASWLASRAFGVDRHHGVSLVPLADIFNHKAAHVDLTADYVVEGMSDEDSSSAGVDSDSRAADSAGDSDADSEPDADEALASGASRALNGANADPKARPSKRGSIVQQAGTTSNASVTSAVEATDCDQHTGRASKRPRIARQAGADLAGTADEAGARDPALRLEIGICSVTEGDEDYLQIVAASDIPAGNEVHNTYGELGNAELVAKYGFALRDNPFTCIQLDKQALLATAKRTLGAKGWRARCKMLEEHSELLDEDSEPFEILPGGRIGPALIMVLRVLFAPKAVWASWASWEDVMHDADAPGSDGDTVSIADAREAALPSYACAALRSLLEHRLEQYQHPGPSTSAEEAKLQALSRGSHGSCGGCGSGAGDAGDGDSEHASACRAALRLVISEKQVLKDALAPLAGRNTAHARNATQ